MTAPSGRRRRRSRFPFALLGICAGLAVAFGVSGTSYAFYNARTDLGGAVISTGSLGLTATAGFTDNQVRGILPGESADVPATLTMSNNRAVATVSARLQIAQPALTLQIKPAACAATGTFVGVTTTAASLGNFTAGEVRTVCLRVTVPLTDNSPLADLPFTVIFDATQRQP